MRALFYDTETTGLPLFNDPSDHPGQPHIVQLAALLVDVPTRAVLSGFDVTVRPAGWTIPDEVAAIHGITTEKAAACGVPEALAVEMLIELASRASLLVAHNEPFDRRIVRIALKREFEERTAEEWAAMRSECTAQQSTPILALPPTDKMKRAGFTKHKMPKLSEAYRFFTGRELENAHSALADVQACQTVWFAMRDRALQAA